jgi:hypothetical protein
MGCLPSMFTAQEFVSAKVNTSAGLRVTWEVLLTGICLKVRVFKPRPPLGLPVPPVRTVEPR